MLTRLMKKKKKKKEEEEEEERNLEIDRLSSLPQELVIHILSFLTTKEAIQACFSLKKWVNLWTLIPNLHFDTSIFKNPSSFDKFVSKVLALHDGSIKIDKFYYRSETSKSIPKILKFVVSHEVQHLALDVWNEGNDVIDHVDSCDSVRSLTLLMFHFRRSICLKQVVTLHLQYSAFFVPESFSGCPNLKNLTLCMCHFKAKHSMSPLSIVAPQLSRLTVWYCFIDLRICEPPKLVLSTPRLTYLKLVDSNLPLLQTDDLAFLDTFDADVKMDYCLPKKRKQKLFSTLISFLKCISSAKSVRLSCEMVKILSEFPDELAREPSPFCNLRSVNIAPSDSMSIPVTFPGHVMTYLLGKSPHAKTVFEEQKAKAARCIRSRRVKNDNHNDEAAEPP